MTLIAQISDLHVREPGQLCYGRSDTNAFLAKAVAALNALTPRPELVLCAGDLVDKGTAAEYAHLRELLAKLEIPFHLAMGNHDHRDRLREAFSDHAYLGGTGFVQYAVDGLAVRLLVLDTQVPGEGRGELCAERVAWLEARLAEKSGPTAIFLHHPPYDLGNPHMDRYRLTGTEALEAVVSRYAQVVGLYSGHFHRATQLKFGGTVAMSCPSTAHQLAPGLGEGAPWGYDFEPPGFLLHHWDGRRFMSEVRLVERFPAYAFKDGSPL